MKYYNNNFKEFLKEMYYFELDRKDRLNSKLTIPISIAGFFLGGISYFLKKINYFSTDYVSYLFLLLLFITITSTFITIYFIIKSFRGFTYRYIPAACVIESDIDRIVDYFDDPYFESYGDDEKNEMIDRKVYELLNENYIECIDKNIYSNDLKNKYITKSVNSIIVTLILLFITAIPFFYKVSSIDKQNISTIINLDKGNNDVQRQKETTATTTTTSSSSKKISSKGTTRKSGGNRPLQEETIEEIIFL